MESKTVKDSSVTLSQVMGLQEANLAGNVQGGIIMKLIETTAGIVAMRHARSNAVIASMNRLDFNYPVFPGDLVTLKASVNLVGKTSMEIGVRVETENLMTGEVRHNTSAYLTYVALDKFGKPIPLPPLVLESEDDARRNLEAQARRDSRFNEKKSESVPSKR